MERNCVWRLSRKVFKLRQSLPTRDAYAMIENAKERWKTAWRYSSHGPLSIRVPSVVFLLLCHKRLRYFTCYQAIIGWHLIHWSLKATTASDSFRFIFHTLMYFVRNIHPFSEYFDDLVIAHILKIVTFMDTWQDPKHIFY